MDLVSVVKFSESVGTNDTEIYRLIQKGVILIAGRSQKILVNPVTQTPRYYYYKQLQGGLTNFKVSAQVLQEIDKLSEVGAEYSVKTAQTKLRETQEKELGLGINGTAHERVTDANGKRVAVHNMDADSQLLTMAKAKLRKEEALAQKAEIDCAEREGRLIDKSEMIAMWTDIGIKVQRAILSLPDRLAPVLSGETDSHKIHRLMTQELKYALRNLSMNIGEQNDTEEEEERRETDN